MDILPFLNNPGVLNGNSLDSEPELLLHAKMVSWLQFLNMADELTADCTQKPSASALTTMTAQDNHICLSTGGENITSVSPQDLNKLSELLVSSILSEADCDKIKVSSGKLKTELEVSIHLQVSSGSLFSHASLSSGSSKHEAILRICASLNEFSQLAETDACVNLLPRALKRKRKS